MPKRTRVSRSFWQNGKRVVTFFSRGHVPKESKEVDHLICPMCEKHICKHSKPMLVEHQERLILEARADERARVQDEMDLKHKYTYDDIHTAEQEARADERRKCAKEMKDLEDQELGVAIHCDKHEQAGRAEERKALIIKLTSEVALAAVANVLLSHTARNEKYEDLPNKVIGRPMAYGLKEADCKTYWRERAREHIKAAIKASESLEGNHQIAHVNGGSKSKPDKAPQQDSMEIGEGPLQVPQASCRDEIMVYGICKHGNKHNPNGPDCKAVPYGLDTAWHVRKHKLNEQLGRFAKRGKKRR